MFNGWLRAKSKGGRSAARDFSQLYQLSESSLEAIEAGRAEYASTLAELMFIPRDAAREIGRRGGGGFDGSAASPWLQWPINRNWENGFFIKASICAGFYPSILRVQPATPKFVEVHGGTMEVEPEASDVKLYDRERGRVFIHPGSVCFTVGKYSSGFVAYTSITQTSKLFVREASMVPVYSLLLFGGQLTLDVEGRRLAVGDVAVFKAPPAIGALVKRLREQLDGMLAEKVRDPSLELADSGVAAAVMQLLSTDGF